MQQAAKHQAAFNASTTGHTPTLEELIAQLVYIPIPDGFTLSLSNSVMSWLNPHPRPSHRQANSRVRKRRLKALPSCQTSLNPQLLSSLIDLGKCHSYLYSYYQNNRGGCLVVLKSDNIGSVPAHWSLTKIAERQCEGSLQAASR